MAINTPFQSSSEKGIESQKRCPLGTVLYIHSAKAHCHLQWFINEITAIFHMQQQFSFYANNASKIKTLLVLSRKAWHFLEVNKGTSSSHASLEKQLPNFSFAHI